MKRLLLFVMCVRALGASLYSVNQTNGNLISPLFGGTAVITNAGLTFDGHPGGSTPWSNSIFYQNLNNIEASQVSNIYWLANTTAELYGGTTIIQWNTNGQFVTPYSILGVNNSDNVLTVYDNTTGGAEFTNASTLPSIANKLPLAGGTMSGNIAMGSNRITGLPSPSSTSEPTTLNFWESTANNEQVLSYQAQGSSIKALSAPTYTLSQSVTLGAGTIYWTPIWVPYAQTVNGVGTMLSQQGAYTVQNYSGVGLYSLSGTTVSLVSSSANGTNMFTQTANTFYKQAFTNTPSISAGLYYVGVLYNASATGTSVIFRAPTFTTANLATLDVSTGLGMSRTTSGQSALPTSLNLNGNSSGSSIPVWVTLY